MLRNDFDKLYKAGCIQTCADVYETLEKAREKALERFSYVMAITQCDPCEGCPIDENKCEAYKLYHFKPISEKNAIEQRRVAATSPPCGETVAAAAKRLGISKNEVRRRRQKGELA